MNNKTEELRHRAEKQFREEKTIASPGGSSVELQRLVHELKVHQIELEIQNEELQQARSELESFLSKYTDLYDFAPVGYFTLGRDGTIRQANLTGATLLGVERSKLANRHFGFFIASEYRPTFNAFLEMVFKKQSKETCEAALKKGKKPLYVQLEAVTFGDGKKCRIAVIDITDRKQAEKALSFQFQFEKMVSNISYFFVSLPSKQLTHGVTRSLKLTGEFFQVDRSYVVQFSADGQTMSCTHEWCANGFEAQISRVQNLPVDAMPWWAEQVRNNDHINIFDVDRLPPEAESEKKEFKVRSIRSLLCIPMIINGALIGFLGFDSLTRKKEWNEDHVMLLKFVAELISNAIVRGETEVKMRYLSFHDSLTGLYNRAYLEEEMQRMDVERQLPISIIMADLNGLKLINDTYGHRLGDELLKKTAEVLRESCRIEDIIARWGGDEFIVFLPQTSEKEAKALIKRIYDQCCQEYVADFPISMGLGVATKKNSEKKLTQVLKEAEDEMYKSKLTEVRSEKGSLLKALFTALEEKSFETKKHTQCMQDIALKIGEKLDLSESELKRLELLISLHDVGKINIPEEIVAKKSSLSAKEWEAIKKHPETGFRIARTTVEFAHVAEDILAHHERWDGSGYPRGLKGKEIPLLARITAIADAHEVMTNGRPYKKAMPPGAVAAEFKNCSGTQFDPDLVGIFLLILEGSKELIPGVQDQAWLGGRKK